MNAYFSTLKLTSILVSSEYKRLTNSLISGQAWPFSKSEIIFGLRSHIWFFNLYFWKAFDVFHCVSCFSSKSFFFLTGCFFFSCMIKKLSFSKSFSQSNEMFWRSNGNTFEFSVAVGDDEVALLFACGDSKFKSELNEFSWHSLVSESESNTILRGLQSDIFWVTSETSTFSRTFRAQLSTWSWLVVGYTYQYESGPDEPGSAIDRAQPAWENHLGPLCLALEKSTNQKVGWFQIDQYNSRILFTLSVWGYAPSRDLWLLHRVAKKGALAPNRCFWRWRRCSNFEKVLFLKHKLAYLT